MLPAGSGAQYYVEDFLGSSRVVTQNNGVPCYDADFTPYGHEKAYTNTCGQNAYKFEGKERDSETQNDDFGARYYTWHFGRWLSADWSAIPVPVPYANFTNPQTLNLYAMVADDPESFADLDGHQKGPAAPPASEGQCSKSQAGSDQTACDAPGQTDQDRGKVARDQESTQRQTTQVPQTTQPAQPYQPQMSAASVGVVALPILTRAGIGALEGGEAGGAAGTVEPGGGNLVGAVAGAAAGATIAVLAPHVYSKSKDEAQKAWTKFNTAVAHLGKLAGPDKDPSGGWKRTVRRIAENMDQHADRMTGHQGAANAIRFGAELLRGLVPNDPI